MNRFRASCFACLFSSLLWMSACGSDFDQTRQDLDKRMNTQLAPDIAANRVALELLPDGERVTLVDPSLFSGGGTKMNSQGQEVLVAFIHALLEPRIYTLQVEDTRDTRRMQEGARATAVEQYLSEVGFGSQLQPYPPAQEILTDGVGTPPPGVELTVRLIPVEICRINRGPQAECP